MFENKIHILRKVPDGQPNLELVLHDVLFFLSFFSDVLIKMRA